MKAEHNFSIKEEMKYNLSKGQLFPLSILCSIVCVPLIVGLIVYVCVDYKMPVLVILCLSLAIYIVLMLVIWRISSKRDYYFLIDETHVEIVFLDMFSGKTKLILDQEQIKKIAFDRPTLKNFLKCALTLSLPNRVDITFIENGEEKTKAIGHIRRRDAEEIAQKLQVELNLH